MLCNVVDVPPLCSFILPAIVRTGPIAIAISTAGSSPALAKRMKREIGELFGDEYAELAELLNEARGWAKATLPTYDDRKSFFEGIVNGSPDPVELLRAGDRQAGSTADRQPAGCAGQPLVGSARSGRRQAQRRRRASAGWCAGWAAPRSVGRGQDWWATGRGLHPGRTSAPPATAARPGIRAGPGPLRPRPNDARCAHCPVASNRQTPIRPPHLGSVDHHVTPAALRQKIDRRMPLTQLTERHTRTPTLGPSPRSVKADRTDRLLVGTFEPYKSRQIGRRHRR